MRRGMLVVERPPGTGRGRVAGFGALATLGYILSPLSWWNDAFVNIPLAIVIAKLLSLAGVDFAVAFYTAYAATNVAGMVMLHVGVHGLARRAKLGRRELAKSVAVAVAYSVAIYPLLRLLKLV